MPYQNNISKVFRSYETYFEPSDLSPKIGYTKPHKYSFTPVVDQVVEDSKQEYPPKDWVARIAIACIEVLHGKRSVAQMRRICSHRVAKNLEIKQSVLSGRKAWGPVRIVKIRFSEGLKDSVEVTINFEYENKVYPMAMNLVNSKEGWKINACEIGPH